MSTPASPPSLSASQALHLVLLSALVGVPAALLAAVFIAVIHKLQHWLWQDLPHHLDASGPPWYLVLGLPIAGACVVLVARRLLPGDGGHEPLGAISVAPTPLAHAPGVALAAIGTLAFGAVLGPEGPLIALGSVVGVVVASFARTNVQQGHVLSIAGSFSAISALFGGPLVAGMLLLEAGVGLGASIIPILIPGLVAASIGYLIFIGLGDWGGIDATPLSVPGLPAYDGVHLRDLAIAVGVGVAMALLVEAVRRLAGRIAGPGRARVGMPVLLLAGALAVGALALLADALGASSQDVLFSGQTSIPGLVTEDSTRIVLVLIAAKALAYAVCLGCGFRGGPVFPAIFLGVALGTLAVIAFDLSPTLAVAVGTAAGTVAMTRLLFTSIIFAGLLVGTAGIDAVPVAALAAVAAWLTATAIDERFPLRGSTSTSDVAPG
jgi:chloride channel protein, CIC family